MRMWLCIPAVLVATMASCNNDGRENGCTLQAVFGVTARIVDGDSGAAITNADVTLTATNYRETMLERSPGVYVGASERPGTYTVTANAVGYSLQSAIGIVVEDGACNVTPQTVTVPVYNLNGPIPVEIWWLDPRDGRVTVTVGSTSAPAATSAESSRHR